MKTYQQTTKAAHKSWEFTNYSNGTTDLLRLVCETPEGEKDSILLTEQQLVELQEFLYRLFKDVA